MADVVITEFPDEEAVVRLTADFDVFYDPDLVNRTEELHERLPADNVFDGVPNVALTPHCAGLTKEALLRSSLMIADAVRDALERAGRVDVGRGFPLESKRNFNSPILIR